MDRNHNGTGGTSLELPSAVLVVDVGPRDGLQNEAHPGTTADKVRLVNDLARAGVRRIEATSFVSPRAVPQMADAAEVMAGIERLPGTEYAVLVPNARGLERAIDAGADIVNVVVAASETFNRRNVNMSVADSMAQTAQIVQLAGEAGVRVTAVLAISFFCPFEGLVPEERVLDLVGQFADLGIVEITLADTIGAANPAQVYRRAVAVGERWPHLETGIHLHDTRGLGLANALAALQGGMRRLEASVGGIGGCPFAPKATGNVCSEDLVYMLESMGVATGIDLGHLIEIARRIPEIVQHPVPSRMVAAGPPATVPAVAG
ncbi:MAG: hydroxymethylglutaryl-CoA lyase [Dehalococcoidia bacterium]